MHDQLQKSSHPLVLHNQHQPFEELATLNSDTNATYLIFQGQKKLLNTRKSMNYQSINLLNINLKYQCLTHINHLPTMPTLSQGKTNIV